VHCRPDPIKRIGRKAIRKNPKKKKALQASQGHAGQEGLLTAENRVEGEIYIVWGELGTERVFLRPEEEKTAGARR